MFDLLLSLRPASGEAIAGRCSQRVSKKSIAVDARFICHGSVSMSLDD
jgi:hypothetical protein